MQFVSDQELEGAVKADVRQYGPVRFLTIELRRPKAQKPEIGLLGRCAGEAAKRIVAFEKFLGIRRQVARKGRDLGVAIEGLAIAAFACGWRAQDRGQLFAAALYLRAFAGSVPWAHLDIAGPARAGEDDAEGTVGATGFGVRLLGAWLERLSR